MKKICVCCLSCLAVYSAFAAEEWHVSQQSTNKNVLIEEFTGIHCGYCPQAHAIVNDMTTARPEAINVIAIHAGGFAVPAVSIEPDFRTDAGTLIHDAFGIGSYPSGMVNRVALEGENDSPVVGRSVWYQLAREEVQTAAEVNIWAKAVYEGSERQLTVEVEGYLQADALVYPDMRLNIALTQNNIEGPQNGGLDGNKYLHQHVLRDYLTEPFGDAINADMQQLFRAKYAYCVPETWNGIAADPRELMVVVYVTSGKNGEVLNSITQIPEYENYEPRATYQLTDYKVATEGTVYGYDFIDLYLRNLSAMTVTDARFEISMGQKQVTSDMSDLDILPMHKALLRIPCEGIVNGDGKIKVNLTQINGKSVAVTPLEMAVYEAPKVHTQLKLVIRTDNFAADNTWTIRDSKGCVVMSFGPFTDGIVTDFSQDLELEDGVCYCLEVEDSWGDGVQDPRGIVKLYDMRGNLMVSDLQIQTHGTRLFFFTDATMDIAETFADLSDADKTEFFTIDGKSLGREIPSNYPGVVVRKDGSKAILLRRN